MDKKVYILLALIAALILMQKGIIPDYTGGYIHKENTTAVQNITVEEIYVPSNKESETEEKPSSNYTLIILVIIGILAFKYKDKIIPDSSSNDIAGTAIIEHAREVRCIKKIFQISLEEVSPGIYEGIYEVRSDLRNNCGGYNYGEKIAVRYLTKKGVTRFSRVTYNPKNHIPIFLPETENKSSNKSMTKIYNRIMPKSSDDEKKEKGEDKK